MPSIRPPDRLPRSRRRSAEPVSYELERCPFETVIVDVTHKCNMTCRNCYIPNRAIPDLDRDWLRECLARLPARRFVRLVGAEPTVRPDLPALIADVRASGHHPVLLTNGLKLADRRYVQELKAAGVQVIYLSMNGGFDDDLYLEIDGQRCGELKTLAFQYLRAAHVFTSVGMIVIAGRNTRALGPLVQACHAARNVRELHLRSVGAVGRFVRTLPVTLDRMLELYARACGRPNSEFPEHERTPTSREFRDRRLRVQLTAWPDLGNRRRGRLTPEGRVAPFFEHVLAHEGGY